MAEFFQNAWAWIAAHSDVIAGVLTPANLVLLVSTVLSIVKAKKTITANTNVTSDVGKALKDTKVLQTIRDNAKEIADLKAQNGDLTDLMNQAITKLNAVLEVQESAYNASQLPKETLVAIRNFIAAGKFAESKAHAAVADEITALKAQIKLVAEASEATEERIKKLTNTAEAPVKAADKPKTEGVRYD